MRDVVVDLGDEHRAQRRERHVADRRIERHVEHLLVGVERLEPQGRAAAARELQAERARVRIEHDLADVDERPLLELDRPDQERRAVGAPFQIHRRQRARAPVAVLRIEHQHFLGAVLRAGPELQQLRAGLDPVADAHRHDGLAPEIRNGEADQLPFGVFEDRDAARLLGDERRGREIGTVVQVEAPSGRPRWCRCSSDAPPRP